MRHLMTPKILMKSKFNEGSGMMSRPFTKIVGSQRSHERVHRGNVHGMDTFFTFALIIQFHSVHTSGKMRFTRNQRLLVLEIGAMRINFIQFHKFVPLTFLYMFDLIRQISQFLRIHFRVRAQFTKLDG